MFQWYIALNAANQEWKTLCLYKELSFQGHGHLCRSQAAKRLAKAEDRLSVFEDCQSKRELTRQLWYV